MRGLKSSAGHRRSAHNRVLVGVVGPCSSGKSTLVKRLRVEGYRAREIRQEHSAAPDMWRRLADPDYLIYLDVSMEEAAAREGLEKPSSWWPAERQVRLVHAREHCDLYINTTGLTPVEVYQRVSQFLRERLRRSG
ncbi:MAG: hypothetical protein ACP5HS_14045 [Anaerolineae bacterium]